jgi:hypothetical protein
MRPDGTAERAQPTIIVQPSLRDSTVFVSPPSVETLGYYHKSLRDGLPGTSELHWS